MQIIPPINQVSAEITARPVTGHQRNRGAGFAEIMAAGMDSEVSILGQVRRAVGNQMRHHGGIDGADKQAAVAKDEETDTAGVIPFISLAAAGLSQPASIPEAQDSSAAGSVADILEGQTETNMDMDDLVAGAGQGGSAAASPEDEILARMPETANQTVLDPAADAGEADGSSCPLENASDTPVAQAPRSEATRLSQEAAAETQVINTDTEANQITAEAQFAGDRGSGLESDDEAQAKIADGGDSAAAAATAGFQIDAAPLRMQGESQMVRQAQATNETLMDTMVEQISLEAVDGKNTVEIQLKPDFLGKVSIQLTMDGNGIHARIRAEDPEVKSLIGGQINQLINSLEQKGIRMAAVDVVYTGAQAGGFDQGGQSREGMSQENRNRPLAAKAIGRSAPGYDAQLDPDAEAETVLDSRISSVEYRA